MLLLTTAIESMIMDWYRETNNINEACRLTENEFRGIRLEKELDNNQYKINIYSIINNTYMDTIDNIPENI